MIIPYRVKNPPKYFPIATITLIALNVGIFALTTHSFLVIREEIVKEFALRWGVSPLVTIFSSMFLHGDIFHLLGNMLFLWVFGPAVEDRVGIAMYLFLYFIAGIAGDVAQAALGYAGAIGMAVPSIGASGCIMGVLGAYWWLFSWSKVCVFYWIFWFWRGTLEVAAVWVIGFYIALDIVNGFLANSVGAVGGVASFAHVGGALAGLVIVVALRHKRDSSDVSQVKAMQSDYKDLEYMDPKQMFPLVKECPDDKDLLVTYVLKSMRQGEPADIKYALDLDTRTVVTRCPEAAIFYLMSNFGSDYPFSSVDLLYLARIAEESNQFSQAISIHEVIAEKHSNTSEYEKSLYRSAHIYWVRFKNANAANERLELLLELFPAGPCMFEAEDLYKNIHKAGGDYYAA